MIGLVNFETMTIEEVGWSFDGKKSWFTDDMTATLLSEGSFIFEIISSLSLCVYFLMQEIYYSF